MCHKLTYNTAMKPIIEQLSSLLETVRLAISDIDLAADEKKLCQLEDDIAQPDFWNNQTQAEKISIKAAELKKNIDKWRSLESDIKVLLELAEVASDNQTEDFNSQLKDLKRRVETATNDLKLSGEFDAKDAIIQISAGVGGTDAQDWAEMLLSMYTKYAEKQGWRADLVDVSYGEEAGIKSATLEIKGRFAYGKLKAEKGVHRLVRLSPFNAQSLRQTSFALVDVIPELDEKQIEINPQDLRIDTYRSSGHGGQSVNTTDSAVRITHLPTGVNVAIQNERSQVKNKAKAMSILASRLSQLAWEQHLDSIAQLRGKMVSADWGSQIRSYVLHPYTKVKDHRTGYETSRTADVLNGDLEPFIQAYLQSLVKT